MTSGQLIKKFRERAGMTQRDLGEKLGIAPQTIAQWETNLRNPKVSTLKKIAAALGIDYVNLMPDMYQFDITTSRLSEAFRSTIMAERMKAAFAKLNDQGQEIALERIEELTEMPRYQKKGTE